MRTSLLQLLGQAVAFAAFGAVVGYFSSAPSYGTFDAQAAQIKLSFSHGGARAQECRQRTPEEIAALPPNMRQLVDCPRERVPVVVELELDGKLVYRESLAPSGVWRDGLSTVYERFAVASGSHRLTVRLRDSRREQGFDHERLAEIALAPRQIFVIDFRADKGGFILR